MAFEDVKAEIALLLTQLTDRPHDRQEFEMLLREKLRELRAFGMPLPDDLVALEQALDNQLASEGRTSARRDVPERDQ